MIQRLIIILFIAHTGTLFSQRDGIDHHIEYGILLGGSNYSGDLLPQPSLRQFGPSAGIFYRHHLRDKISVIRFNLQAGSLRASEENSNFPVLNNRQLSFLSLIHI